MIYVASFAYAVLDSLQRPSLDALVPRIVPPDQLAAAGALNSLRMNIGTIAGPAVGGLLISAGGVALAFAVDFVTYSASLVALAADARGTASDGGRAPQRRQDRRRCPLRLAA